MVCKMVVWFAVGSCVLRVSFIRRKNLSSKKEEKKEIIGDLEIR